MWIVEASQGHCFVLRPNESYIVGRLRADIVVSDDSVSRNHGKFELRSDCHGQHVTYRDLGSKFGSYLGEKAIASSQSCSSIAAIQLDRLPAHQAVTVESGTRIRIGLGKTIFNVVWRPLVVMPSGLSQAEKVALVRTVSAFGESQVTDSWRPDVTHVVMTKFNLTLKAACALVRAVPIVKPDFFDNFVQCIACKRPLPAASQFLSPCRDSSMRNLLLAANMSRQTLFAGKTFAFAVQAHRDKFAACIEGGGGSAILFAGDSPSHCNPDAFADPTHLLVQPNQAQYVCLSQDARRESLWMAAEKVVAKAKLRLISECEIGQAIILCNVSQHCNPAAALKPSYGEPLINFSSSSLVQAENGDWSQASEPHSSISIFSATFTSPKPPVRSKTSAVQTKTTGNKPRSGLSIEPEDKDLFEFSDDDDEAVEVAPDKIVHSLAKGCGSSTLSKAKAPTGRKAKYAQNQDLFGLGDHDRDGKQVRKKPHLMFLQEPNAHGTRSPKPSLQSQSASSKENEADLFNFSDDDERQERYTSNKPLCMVSPDLSTRCAQSGAPLHNPPARVLKRESDLFSFSDDEDTSYSASSRARPSWVQAKLTDVCGQSDSKKRGRTGTCESECENEPEPKKRSLKCSPDATSHKLSQLSMVDSHGYIGKSSHSQVSLNVSATSDGVCSDSGHAKSDAVVPLVIIGKHRAQVPQRPASINVKKFVKQELLVRAAEEPIKCQLICELNLTEMPGEFSKWLESSRETERQRSEIDEFWNASQASQSRWRR